MYFKDDLKYNTDFIKAELDKYSALKYSAVIIANGHTNPSWEIYSFNKTYLAWQGINYNKPNWAYIIWGSDISTTVPGYIEVKGHGFGIDDTKQNSIEKIIEKIEEHNIDCKCNLNGVIS